MKLRILALLALALAPALLAEAGDGQVRDFRLVQQTMLLTAISMEFLMKRMRMFVLISTLLYLPAGSLSPAQISSLPSCMIQVYCCLESVPAAELVLFPL